MATILELGYQKHGCFHNLSYDVCKPIYYEGWKPSDGVIKNSDCIKFTVKSQEDTDTFINCIKINCIKIIVLNHAVNDFEVPLDRGEVNINRKVNSQINFNSGDIQFTVS